MMTLSNQEIDDQVRALSDDGEATCYVAAMNPWLSHVLGDTGFLPSVLAVRAGSFGLEILLDGECAMPEQFVALGDNGKAWRLGSSVSERDMKHDAGTAEPYCPAPIPVGDTSSGQLLLDVEQIGAASVSGPAEDRDGFLREIVLGAMAAPWTKDCEVVVIGVPGINPMPGSRLVSPTDPVAWAQKIAKSVARDARDTTSSPYEGGVEGVVERHPTIVGVGSEFAAAAQHLAGAAMLSRSSLTLIAGSELTSEARIVLTGTKVTLELSGDAVGSSHGQRH